VLIVGFSGWSRSVEVEADAEHANDETDRRGDDGRGQTVEPERMLTTVTSAPARAGMA